MQSYLLIHIKMTQASSNGDRYRNNCSLHDTLNPNLDFRIIFIDLLLLADLLNLGKHLLNLEPTKQSGDHVANYPLSLPAPRELRLHAQPHNSRG